MKGFRKRWAAASDEERSLHPQGQISPTDPFEEARDEDQEVASSSWVDVSVTLDPDADREQEDGVTCHRPKMARRHDQVMGTAMAPLPPDIRGAVEATIPLKVTMFWEAGILAHVLGKPIGPYRPVTMIRTPAPIPRVDSQVVASVPRVISLGHAKLRSLRAGPPEDDRVRATHRFKVLLLLDPLATRAGRQMTDLAGLCSDDEKATGILEDILAPKSSGTLVKRSGALWRYAAFLSLSGEISPFCAGETSLYNYLQKLKGDQCTSTASSLLEALRFANALFGFTKVTIAELDSPRVRGASHAMFVTKRVRSNAPPIPVEVVKFMISVAADPFEEPHVSLIAGQLLQCVFGVGRWSDFRKATSLEVDDAEGTVVWNVWTSEHKTATSQEAKTRLLPFIGLGFWPGLGNWAGNVSQIRQEAGIASGLPSWNHAAQEWNPWPMSSAEATAWLREFAEYRVSADEARNLRSHSCKHTLLTWAGGSGLFTREERTMLGHHVEASTKSATTYDRNTMLAIHGKVLKMIYMIEDGSYRPDDSVAARLRQMAGGEPGQDAGGEPRVDGAARAGASSSSDDNGDPKEVIEHQREPLPEDADMHQWFRHTISSIVHVAADPQGERLRCGRQVSCNFEQVNPSDLDRVQCLFCVQCSRSQEPGADA